MKTACFKTYDGPGRVAITRGTPRGAPKGYRLYRTLAPTWPMLRMSYGQYRETFFRDILGPLDPQTEWDSLHDLAGGHEPVLLCFERPPFAVSNWCHRRMVATWFRDTLGHPIEEIGHGLVEERGGAQPSDMFADVSDLIGKTFTYSGHAYSVVMEDPDNPGQAVVRDEVDGTTFPVPADRLRERIDR